MEMTCQNDMENLKESSERHVEVVCEVRDASKLKKVALCRKEGEGSGRKTEKEEGLREDGWTD